jgi:uncharacterized protein YbdZ (MbtH family)
MNKSNPAAALNPFADLDSLRLNTDYTETVGVKKLLRTVPVRKPGPQDWVRVHPELRLTPAALLEIRDDREMYFVLPSAAPELTGEYYVATLYLATNRQGTPSLWPVRLPGPDGKLLDWHRSAQQAAEIAQTQWTRLRANMNLGAYEIQVADGTAAIPEPKWPVESFEEILNIAFRDRFISDIQHPVVQRLRGTL